MRVQPTKATEQVDPQCSGQRGRSAGTSLHEKRNAPAQSLHVTDSALIKTWVKSAHVRSDVLREQRSEFDRRRVRQPSKLANLFRHGWVVTRGRAPSRRDEHDPTSDEGPGPEHQQLARGVVSPVRVLKEQYKRAFSRDLNQHVLGDGKQVDAIDRRCWKSPKLRGESSKDAGTVTDCFGYLIRTQLPHQGTHQVGKHTERQRAAGQGNRVTECNGGPLWQAGGELSHKPCLPIPASPVTTTTCAPDDPARVNASSNTSSSFCRPTISPSRDVMRPWSREQTSGVLRAGPSAPAWM